MDTITISELRNENLKAPKSINIMERLLRVVQELSATQELNTVMEVVRRSVRELTGSDGATFVLRDGNFCYYADEDAISPLWKGKRFPTEICISGWVMLNQKPAIIEDIYCDSRIPIDVYQKTFVKSLAMVPIKTVDPIGAIGCYWAEKHNPTTEQIEILQVLADTAAISIENIYCKDVIAVRTKQLEESIQRFSRLEEVTFEGICIHTNGRILECNAKLESMLGYTKDDLIGMSVFNIILIDSNRLNISSTGSDYINLGKFHAIRKDGALFEIEMLSSDLVFNEQMAKVCAIRDNSRIKTIEESLNKTLEMDRLKTEFFANVSHELRTPLNVIYSTLQLFESYIINNTVNDAEEKIQKRLTSMKSNCYRLMRLINNLIEINKVDSGFASMRTQNIDVVAFIKELCITIEEFMEDKKIEFKFQSNVAYKKINCDPDKIETIILNLVSNAVKFNRPNGKVSVELQDRGEELLIIIADTGIGIAEDVQEKVFERFEHVNKSLTRNYEGSGIGLSLSKSFVEMHGGRIWIDSVYGKGTNLCVCLPIQVEDDNHANIVSPPLKTDILTERVSIELSGLNSIQD